MKLSDITDLTKEDLLAALGLATKPTTSERLLGSLGMFGIGALVGAGVALLLAPSSGQDLRGDLGRRIRRFAPDTASEAANGRPERGTPESRPST